MQEKSDIIGILCALLSKYQLFTRMNRMITFYNSKK